MQTNHVWSLVENYFIDQLQPNNEIMEQVIHNNRKNNLPEIDVSPTQGKFLSMLAKIKGAKNILEIGTLGGYSSIWLAQALPEDGRLVTLEFNSAHVKVAEENIKAAGMENKVTIIEGDALETLPTLQQEKMEGFDFIFIDADKPNNPHYIKWAIQLASQGALIVADNVVRDGKVVNENSEDANVQGVREFIDILSSDTRIDSVGIQTVGLKGYDGFIISRVK